MQNSYGLRIPARGLTVLAKRHSELLRGLHRSRKTQNYAKFSARSRDTHLLLPHRMRVVSVAKTGAILPNQTNDRKDYGRRDAGR
jgi:hypothetical protein